MADAIATDRLASDLSTGKTGPDHGRSGAVGDPPAQVGRETDPGLIDRLTGDQIDPAFAADEIERHGRDFERLVGHVVDRENALGAVDALSPETEQFLAEMQGELRCVRVEGGLPLAE